MSKETLETRLEQLQHSWPGESVASQVVQTISQQPPIFRSNGRSNRRFFPWFGMLAASVALITVGMWMMQHRTLQAAVQEGLRRTPHWHVLSEFFIGDQAVTGEIWFDRDRGFRMESMGQIIVDNGERSYSWSTGDPDATVLLRPSMDGAQLISNLFDLSRIPSDWSKHRSEKDDCEVIGKPCRAYLVSGPEPAKQFLVQVDTEDRPCQMILQEQSNEKWKVRSSLTIEYERGASDGKFSLDIPAKSKIIDVRDGLEGRFPLDKAIESVEKDGIVFAVHDLLPVDQDFFYVVSSVRATSKSSTVASKRLAEVVAQESSHGSSGYGQQVGMFSAEWQGVHYLWRLIVPDKSLQSDVLAKTGKFPIQLVANHLGPNQKPLQTRAELNPPLKQLQYSTLEQVISKARTDGELVRGLDKRKGPLAIAKSMSNGEMEFTSFEKITNEDYAIELLKTRWQVRTGDTSGFALPVALQSPKESNSSDGIAPRITPNAAGQEPAPPRVEVALPERMEGQIVDSQGDPVARAQVTLQIRRFSDDPSREPGPWTTMSDANGNYGFSIPGTIRPDWDELRIRVKADGFTDTSVRDYMKEYLSGKFPLVKLLDGREITGRFVAPNGSPIPDIIVRFQTGTQDLLGDWDSGPIRLNEEGKFTVSIPRNGKTAAAVYSKCFAQRFLDVSAEADQGSVRLAAGKSMRGRVVDRHGIAVANTVVQVQNVEMRVVHAFALVLGIAVRTDDAGFFQLPPLQGNYKLSVSNAAPDFSRQLQETGKMPPKIEERKINFDAVNPNELIILREQK